MAILNNLLVAGASRFLGHVYIQDLDVAGITNFGTLAATDITASGTLAVTGATTLSSTLSVSGTATFSKTTDLSGTANNSPALIVGGTVSQAHIEIDSNEIQGKGSGTTTADLYINNDGGKVNLGKSGLVNVEYNSTTNTSTLTTPVLSATNGSIANAVISNARVTDELIVDGVLETNEMRTNIIKAVGGQLYVAPTFVATNSTTIVCTAVTTSTVSFTITDSTAINSLTYGGANWNSGSKIQFTAKITGNKTNDEPIITFSSAEGTLTSNMNANTHNFSFTVNYTGANTYFKVDTTNNLTYSDMSVMMYQIKTKNSNNEDVYYPVGIYIKSYGNDNKNSYIDVYGGASPFPNARLGLLNGLKDPDDPDGIAPLTIDGATVTGWGLMSSYAYLKGRIVSKSGTIGGWDIGANTLSSRTLGVDGMWLSTENSQTAVKFAGADTALSNWRFGIGSKFGVLNDGTMYCSNAIISGNITATEGNIGGCNIANGTLEISAANIIDTLSASQIDTTSIIIGQNQVNGLTTDLGNAATTATNYISPITGGGIQIHDQSNTSDYIKMISSGISIYKGGNQMANFGDTITINHGTSGNAALTIDSTNGMKMYKLDGTSMAAQLNASGLIVTSGLIGGVSIVDGVMKFPERRNYMLNTWNPSTVAANRPMIKGQATNTAFSSGTYTTAPHGVRVTNTSTGRTYIRFGSSTASSGSMNGLVAGKTYTISFDAAFKQLSSSTGMNNGTTYYTRFYLYDDRTTTGTFTNTAYITLFTYTKALKGTEQSGHYAFTFTLPDNVTMVYLLCQSNISTASHYAAGDYIELDNIMLEEGNIETPWQPAPEDVIVDNIYTANTTTIDGGKITTGSIAADKITVTDLSAFGATIGGWTIGSSSIYSGNATPGYNTSTMVISTGTASTNNIGGGGTASKTWMLSAGTGFGVTTSGVLYATGAKITGELNADTGTFGGSSGFTIATNKLYSNGKSSATSTNNGIYIQSGSTGGIYLGSHDSNKGSCPFQVTAEGVLTSRSGTIGGWTLSDNALYNGTFGINNSVMMSTGYISDRIYIGGSRDLNIPWAFVAGNNFGVSIDGSLYATNGKFSGNISSGAGDIGGWKIAMNQLLSQGSDSRFVIKNASIKMIDISELTVTGCDIVFNGDELEITKTASTSTIEIQLPQEYILKNGVYSVEGYKNNVIQVVNCIYLEPQTVDGNTIYVPQIEAFSEPTYQGYIPPIREYGYTLFTQDGTVYGPVTIKYSIAGDIGETYILTSSIFVDDNIHVTVTDNSYTVGYNTGLYEDIAIGCDVLSNNTYITPLYMTNTGLLHAENLDCTGGTIGGWTINETNLEQREVMSGTYSYYYSSGFGNRTAAGINDSIRLWAGWIENDPSLLPEGYIEEISTDEPSKPFYVTSRGVVHAASGSVFGNLNKAYVAIDDTSFDMYYGGSSILHFGYGNGINSSGTTSTAPYYTIGTRQQPANLEESIIVGNYSLGAGINVTASGYCSIALGNNTTASGFGSIAVGWGSTASNQTSTAMGYHTTASGHHSTAFGDSTTASGSYSTALGSGTTASGLDSTAIGYVTTASYQASTAIGSYTTASGYASMAMGNYTIASGYASTTMGRYTVATASSSTAIGKFNVATRSGSGTEADPYTYTDAGNYAFIIGNGTGDATENRSNALTVDWNGNMVVAGSISEAGTALSSKYIQQSDYETVVYTDVGYINGAFTNTGSSIGVRFCKFKHIVTIGGILHTGSNIAASAYIAMFQLPSGYGPNSQTFFTAYGANGQRSVMWYVDSGESGWIRLYTNNGMVANTTYTFCVSYVQ